MNNFESILSKIKSGNYSKDALVRELQNSMTAEQNETVKSLLNDKALVDKLMASNEAQELLKKLGGENNGY